MTLPRERPGAERPTAPAPHEVQRISRRIRTEPLGYVPSLDGLRAVAVAAVLFYHARFEWIPGGYLGVSAFFTLSGFLITSLLLREWASESALDLRRFWTRRFRRLLPASWITMALVVLFGALGVWNSDQLRSLRGDVPFALLEVVNWHFIVADRSYGAEFTAPSPLEHFWSLAVEQQFYLLLPAVIIGVLVVGSTAPPRRRLRRLVMVLVGLTVVSAVLNGLLGRSSIDRAYFGTDTRMAEMLIGALLACWTLRRTRRSEPGHRTIAVAAGVVAAVVTVWLWHVAALSSSWMYPWGLLVTALCTAAIIHAALQGGVVASVLSVAPLLWLGRISYGVYLLHWPIFLWLSPARTGWSQWPLFGLRVAVTLAASVVLFRLVENPVRHRERLTARRTAPIAAAVMVVLLLGGTWLVTRDLPPPSEIARASAAPSTTLPPPPPVKVLFVGDQSAAAYGDALGTVEGLDVAVSAVPDCGLAVGGWVTLPSGAVERDARRCDSAQQTWIDAIAATQPDVVLVSTAARDLSDRRLDATGTWAPATDPQVTNFLRTDIGRALDDLGAAGTEIVLLTAPSRVDTASPAPLPAAPVNADETDLVLSEIELAEVSRGAPAPGFRANDAALRAAHDAVLAEVAASRNVSVIDVASTVEGFELEPGAPAVLVDGRLALTASGIDELGSWLVETLRNRAPSAAAAPSPPPFAVDAPLPPAPEARDRRHVAAGRRVTALFAGDSATFALAEAATRWGSANGQLAAVNTTQFGCPIARGGDYRFLRDLRSLDARCDWGSFLPPAVAGNRPEVAVVGSGIWEVVDRRLEGDDRYRDLTEPAVARYALIEYVSVIDTLGADGATVVVLNQPHIEPGLDQGYQGLPESDPVRIDRLNELLAEAVSLRPGVATLVDLAGWVGSQPDGTDAANRPDGIHFTDAFTDRIADWLGPQLVAMGRGEAVGTT
ncbi:MAG: acyltransferase family protein [Actinomycetota bacterium]|nr:acyltransferase family protein [Actinomycetota bacterium]